MAALGIGAMWLAYWWGLSGVSMIRGWNNNVIQLANPILPPTFTTACYAGSGFWPTGASRDSGPCGGGSSGVASTTNIKKGQLAGTNSKRIQQVGRGYHGA